MLAYVDDLLLATKKGQEVAHWKALAEAIEFKDAPEPIGQFIGAQYTLDPYDEKNNNAARSLTIDICGYMGSMGEKFDNDS